MRNEEDDDEETSVRELLSDVIKLNQIEQSGKLCFPLSQNKKVN